MSNTGLDRDFGDSSSHVEPEFVGQMMSDNPILIIKKRKLQNNNNNIKNYFDIIECPSYVFVHKKSPTNRFEDLDNSD